MRRLKSLSSWLSFGWHRTARNLLSLTFFILVGLPVHVVGNERDPCSTFDWGSVSPNQWIRLSTCRDSPRKVFHGGSALAPDRNEIFFFGADTHDEDYDNSVYRLNLSTLEWTKDYEADPIEDYQLTKDGYAVTKTGRPWAMHTFDTWDYMYSINKLMTASAPLHAHQAFELLNIKGAVRETIRPGTWLYDPDRKEWNLKKIPTPYLFARGQVWDPMGHQLIGHHGDTTSHYDPLYQKWTVYQAPSIPGWHRKLVFDTFTGKVLSLGHSGGSATLWTYSPTSIVWEKVATSSQPFPANGAAMAYDTHEHILLYLANDSPNPYHNPSGKSVTFVYSSENQSWERLRVNSPPLYGMNFLMQYVPGQRVFLHFEKAPDSHGRIAIWAFRYHANS